MGLMVSHDEASCLENDRTSNLDQESKLHKIEPRTFGKTLKRGILPMSLETNHESPETIVWAYDPQQSIADSKRMVYHLKYWSQKLGLTVRPVSIVYDVFSPHKQEFNLPWEVSFEDRMSNIIKRKLAVVGAGKFLPPRIISSTTTSNRKIAALLAKYASDSQASFIFTNTNAKKTSNPFRLGGFAETLVALAPVPVFLLNPNVKKFKPIHSMLFPADFAPDNRDLLGRVASIATAFKANVDLFSQLETLNFYPADFSISWEPQLKAIDTMMKQMESDRKFQAKSWAQKLSDKNVSSSVLVRRQRRSLAAEIVSTATLQKADLIVMSGRAGPTLQALIGSTVRDVILEAKCPVLVYHRPKRVTQRISSTTKQPRPTRNEMESDHVAQKR